MNQIEKDSLSVIREIVRIADEKKAEEILILDVGNISSITNYFVLCSGNNFRQNKSISDDIYDSLSAMEVKPLHTEGKSGSGWILMDYGDVIINIFLPEIREFYDLEGLWGDAKKLDKNALLSEKSAHRK